MNRHYHVHENMAGYMPSNEPEVYRTKRQAEEAAKWRADQWRDMLAEGMHGGCRVYGNKRQGYTLDDPADPYRIPEYISISKCVEPECLQCYICHDRPGREIGEMCAECHQSWCNYHGGNQS